MGALTALRLLKADDSLLHRLMKEGVLPPLLALLAADGAADAIPAESPILGMCAAETVASAARAIEVGFETRVNSAYFSARN